MITGEYWKMHDDDTIKEIDRAALYLLSEGGARIEHDGLLDLLKSAGCRIDRSAKRCFFTEKLVRDTVEHAGRKATNEVRILAGWSPQARLYHGGSFPHLLEWPDCKRRLATKEDIHDMAKMAHVFPEFAEVGRVLTCAEVDPKIEPLWTTFELAKITDKKIGGGEIFFPQYIEPLVRMGEVLSGKANDASLVAACDFWIAPLIMDPLQAECFIEKRKFGLECMIGTMPVSGMSAPVTIAGTVALTVAELLAGWVLGYLVNPEVPVSGIVATGSLDMRTMSACFGSPEAVLQNVTTVNVIRRLYGISSTWAAVNYTDCKVPGFLAAFNKMYPLSAAPFGTNRTLVADGLLSAGQDYSPVQQLLEFEMNQAIERFWGHFEVNGETLACDLTLAMMKRKDTNFLEEEHTLEHFRTEQWYPRWMDRTQYRGDLIEAESEIKMMQRIDQHIKDAIRKYEPPEIDQVKIKELERIYLNFAKQEGPYK